MPYFNHAATTWPKPEIVYETVDDCFRSLNSPDRTASLEGEQCSAMMQNCRREVAEFFGIAEASHLVFAPSCTYASNLAILGHDWKPGDEAMMSGLEHHAVSRPLRKVAREHGVKFHTIPYAPEQPIDLNFVEDKLRSGKVKLVACTMASNVTGDILPVIELGKLAHQAGALFLVDAAQTAGVVPVDVTTIQADMLTFAGHKGLFGPPGIGGLYVREGIQLNTLAEGGTGKDSGKHEMSGSFPSTYEVGTHNLMAIAGLTAGIRWIKQAGQEVIRQHELELVTRFVNGLQENPHYRLIGSRDLSQRTSVVSLVPNWCKPVELSVRLADSYDISTRSGFHCAPLAHETIGTLPGDGTTRFSFGFSNKPEEIDLALEALAALPETVSAS